MITGIEQAPATLAHYMPGRVRIRVNSPYRNQLFVDQIQELLKPVPGFLRLEARLLTGSVIIHYDPDRLDVSSLLDMGRGMNLIAADGGNLDPTAPMRREVQVIQPKRSQLDVLVPILLLGWALKSMASKDRSPAPWYALLWYAYQIYEHGVHHSKTKKQVEVSPLDLAGETAEVLAATESMD
jgi:hypothetical protein